jgi:CARDB
MRVFVPALAGVLLILLPASTQAAAATRADLKVSALTQAPKSVLAGDRFEVTVAVRNAGARRASRTRLAAFLSDDARRDAGDLRLLGAPGVKPLRRHRRVERARRFHVPEGTPPGRYRLIVCADAGGAVTERSESNNCRTAPADLVVNETSPPFIPPPP